MGRLPGRGAVVLAFAVSGVAGLTYELVWTRYLALLVGHSAYAQVLVLAVFLGGTAAGSLLVAERSRSLARPLRGYALAELALGGFGLLFHPLFLGGQRLLYAVLAPALGEGFSGALATWGVAVMLILPQAVLLGATFPLMAAGWVRSYPELPGRSVADVYLLNTLGGAAGVLLAGFAFVPTLGLPGTVAAAGLLNLVAATLVWSRARADIPLDDRTGPATATPIDGAAPAGAPGDAVTYGAWLLPLLLTATLVSAFASFLYEVGWIRMLSLVLGSATHAFELMLSAFLLGLGLGSLLVRSWTDRARTPVRLLGSVQCAMGLAALLTLPVYTDTFPLMSWLVESLPRTDGGYLLFNLSRYGVALAVMLPATLLAGMTLPLLTGILLRAGAGERVIGQAYGANTLGSVFGAVLGGLLILPTLGLKGILALGAALDMAVGVALLVASVRGRSRRMAVGGGTALAGAALVAAVLALVRLDQAVLTSGVYRMGTIPAPGSRNMLYYRDGATATVAAHRLPDGLTVLTTNGKPDASLPIRWLEHAAGIELVPRPFSGQDESTQTLAPLVLLAQNADARRAAIIGHGSGMSAQLLLGSPVLESLVTIEIEPAMIAGSEAFLPANRRGFGDPRSRFLLDDARSALAGAGERFDLIFSEPSNPWVSGVASLFTVEFYERVRERLAPGGVFGQWIHMYEMEDELILAVLAAIDRTFADWSVWAVGTADVLIVAGAGPLAEPDWSVVRMPDIAADLAHAPLPTPGTLAPLLLLEAAVARPLVRGWRANTDFHPILDTRAERARFLDHVALGLFSFARDPLDLSGIMARRRLEPGQDEPLPITRVVPITRQVLASWLAAGDQRGPPAVTEWERALIRATVFGVRLGTLVPPESWPNWLRAFAEVEEDLHGRSSGWVDTVFYDAVDGYLARVGAPDEMLGAVGVLRGVRGFDFESAAEATDRVGITRGASPPLSPVLMLDAAVVAYLGAGRAAWARMAYDALAPLTGRPQGHMRNLLLDALIREAEGTP